jgi:cytochrome c peroxidase
MASSVREWLGAAGILAATLTFGMPTAPRVQDAVGPHGATPIDRQHALLDAMKLGDGSAPPPGIDPVVWRTFEPADNPTTAAKVALGRALFFDARLSRDASVSCATCHDVARGFADARAASEGIDGRVGRRNAPTTMNVFAAAPAFWDGRSPTLEAQAVAPLVNPIEMGMPSFDAVVAKLKEIPEYPPMFAAAFGRAPNIDDTGRALAAFERMLVFLDAPFDRHRRGDVKALSDAEVRGAALYEGKARCAACHPLNASHPIGSNNRFHNTGVSADRRDFEKLVKKVVLALEYGNSTEEIDHLALATDMGELGRFVITKARHDIGAFRTPQIRNVAVTGPYMHDGSMTTLWDVIDHYNKGGVDNPFLDGGIEALGLAESEIDDLVAFLFALTDERLADRKAKAWDAQFRQSRTRRPHRDDDAAHRRRVGFENASSAKAASANEARRPARERGASEASGGGAAASFGAIDRRDFLRRASLGLAVGLVGVGGDAPRDGSAEAVVPSRVAAPGGVPGGLHRRCAPLRAPVQRAYGEGSPSCGRRRERDGPATGFRDLRRRPFAVRTRGRPRTRRSASSAASQAPLRMGRR